MLLSRLGEKQVSLLHSPLTRVAFAIALGALAGAPGPAAASDLTSYVASTVYFTKAGVYRDQGDMEKADEARKMGTIFLIVGLSLDAVVFVVSLAGLDHVERLDAEVANGGGPITDAYAAAFGLPRQTVLAAIADVQATAPQTGEAAETAVLQRLMPQVNLTDETASRILVGLYQERAVLGTGATPWHQALANLSGVPADQIDACIAPVIDARLAASAVPGQIVSARAALSEDAAVTLTAALDKLVAEHESSVFGRMEALASSAPGAASSR